MYCRGIRGATTVERNAREDILMATTELLQLMVRQNEQHVADIASALFTVTGGPGRGISSGCGAAVGVG